MQKSKTPSMKAGSTQAVEITPESNLMQRLLVSQGYQPEDMTSGQNVIITARWILVLAGFALAIWNPGGIGPLRFQILMIILLAIANFNLHAQLLQKKKTAQIIWYIASIADLVVITLLVLTTGASESNLYVFYFPALLAISVAFPTSIMLFFLLMVIGGYSLMSMVDIATQSVDSMIIVNRLIIFSAVALCGNLYFRLESKRRDEVRNSQELLMAEIEKRRTAKK